MGKLAEKVYMDLVGRGRRVRTARRWRNLVKRFEACCGTKRRYSREDVMRYLVDCRERGLCQNSIVTELRPVKLLAEIQGGCIKRGGNEVKGGRNPVVDSTLNEWRLGNDNSILEVVKPPVNS